MFFHRIQPYLGTRRSSVVRCYTLAHVRYSAYQDLVLLCHMTQWTAQVILTQLRHQLSNNILCKFFKIFYSSSGAVTSEKIYIFIHDSRSRINKIARKIGREVLKVRTYVWKVPREIVHSGTIQVVRSYILCNGL